MMKKISSCILLFLFIVFMFLPSYDLQAKTLRDYYSELSEMEARLNRTEEEKAAAQARINEYSKQISESQASINKAQDDITAAQNKIHELEIEIEKKKEEINNLLKFEQISSGDNVYLEYVFGASDFTDFIYRSAIVEQLSAYNDNLIDEMNTLIEENKKLTKELEEKIILEQEATKKFQSMLAANRIDLSDLSKESSYTIADINAKKEEIEYLKNHNCDMDDEISSCISIPLASGFIKPLVSGCITDNYGWRSTHPVYGYSTMHYGIDIGIGWGTPIYAAATGKVAYTVESYTPGSGGGKQVVLYHNVNGTIYTSMYLHLSSIAVNMGDFVTANTVIGYVGSTGGSTGPHLHFEMHYGESTSSWTAFDPRNILYFPPYDGWFYSRY